MIGARMVGDTEVGEDQPAENLHTAFFCGIGGGSEPAREIAVKPTLGAAGVTILVQPDAIERRGITEGGERRHEHRVGRWAIAGFPSLKHGPYAEVGDERFRMRQALALRENGRRRPLISVHLRNIEHRECAGEHAPMAVVVAVVVIGLPGGWKLPPQHDRGGAFSLADLRAGLLPLSVGAPKAVAIFGSEANSPASHESVHLRLRVLFALPHADRPPRRGAIRARPQSPLDGVTGGAVKYGPSRAPTTRG